jgi:hypothetical protein
VAELRNTFYSFANRSCDPKLWAPYFLRYDPAQWDAEGDGVLQYSTDGGLEYALVITHWSGLGFVLEFKARDLNTNRTLLSKLGVADVNALDRFEEQDGLQYPAGCFLSPSVAWLAVEDFLKTPEQPSGRVQWVDSDDIPWPE